MSRPNFKTYQSHFHILSPIYIGTGEELDPFSYVIHKDILHFIDLNKWIDIYPEKEELMQMIGSDNFTSVRQYIFNNIDLKTCTLRTIPIKTQKLMTFYEKAIHEKRIENQVLINPMTRNDMTKIAYIPGSSIKGAIRTAIANALVDKARVTSRDAYGRDNFNQKIFGPAYKDPMKNLKISDISLDTSGTVIVEAKEMSRDPNKSLTPKGFVEATVNEMIEMKEISYPLRVLLNNFNLLATEIDIHFIIDALNSFYKPKFFEDEFKFYEQCMPNEGKETFERLKQDVENMAGNEALIRIGHFSHIECVTLDNVRKPRTRKGKDGRPLPWGTTRTLANGIYPFGWAKITFVGIHHTPAKIFKRNELKKPAKMTNTKHNTSHQKQKKKNEKMATIEDLMKKFNER